MDKFPTPELQQAHLTELINGFGSLSDSGMKFTVADILCLAKMVYESGDMDIVTKIQIQILQLHTRVEEGILIATQDLGYIKKPRQKEKSFKIFREIRNELSSKSIERINENTRRDIIVIDMLSRAFLLEDVMINQGNFGMAFSTTLFEPFVSSSKWKIIDFISPTLRRDIGDDYSYVRHYGGSGIFHSFRVGNVSHSYNRDGLEVICHILSEEHAQDLWLPAIERLSIGTPRYLPVADALERAFIDIRGFMERNTSILQIKPDRMKRRMADLDAYKSKVMQNFTELECSAREYVETHARAAPQPE